MAQAASSTSRFRVGSDHRAGAGHQIERTWNITSSVVDGARTELRPRLCGLRTTGEKSEVGLFCQVSDLKSWLAGQKTLACESSHTRIRVRSMGVMRSRRRDRSNEPSGPCPHALRDQDRQFYGGQRLGPRPSHQSRGRHASSSTQRVG